MRISASARRISPAGSRDGARPRVPRRAQSVAPGQTRVRLPQAKVKGLETPPVAHVMPAVARRLRA
jgi:hypothetical protein